MAEGDTPKSNFVVTVSAKDETKGVFDQIGRSLMGLGQEAKSAGDAARAAAGQAQAEARVVPDTHGEGGRTFRQTGQHFVQHFRGVFSEIREAAKEASKEEEAKHGEKHAGHEGEHKAEGSEHAEGGGEHGEVHEARHHGGAAIYGHLRLLREHGAELGESFGEANESLASVAPMLAGFGAILGAEGLVDMVHEAAEAQAQLGAMAAQLGVTANQLEALNFAAKMSDVSVDEFDRGMARLGVSMAQVAQGGAKQAALAFKTLGISVTDGQGHLKSMAEVMPQLAGAISKVRDPAERLALVTAIFGRGGRELLPLLMQGADGFERLTEEAEAFGPALTDADREHMEGFIDSWKVLDFAVESFKDRLSADLAPVLTPILDDLAKWVHANQDWIGLDVADSVRAIADAFRDIDLKDIVGDFATVMGDLNAIVDMTGGWKVAMLAVLGLMGVRVVSPFIGAAKDVFHMLAWSKDFVRIMTTEMMEAFGASEAAILAANGVFEATPLGRILLLGLAAYEGFRVADRAISAMPGEVGRHVPHAVTAAPEPPPDEQVGRHVHHVMPDTPAGMPAFAPALAVPNGASPVVPVVPNLPPGERRAFETGLHGGVSVPPPRAVPKPDGSADGGDNGGSSGDDEDSGDTAHGDGDGTVPAAGADDASLAQLVQQPLKGSVSVYVSFENAPTGLTVRTESSGDVDQPRVDVGYSWPGMLAPLNQ